MKQLKYAYLKLCLHSIAHVLMHIFTRKATFDRQIQRYIKHFNIIYMNEVQNTTANTITQDTNIERNNI